MGDIFAEHPREEGEGTGELIVLLIVLKEEVDVKEAVDLKRGSRP